MRRLSILFELGSVCSWSGISKDGESYPSLLPRKIVKVGKNFSLLDNGMRISNTPCDAPSSPFLLESCFKAPDSDSAIYVSSTPELHEVWQKQVARKQLMETAMLVRDRVAQIIADGNLDPNYLRRMNNCFNLFYRGIKK